MFITVYERNVRFAWFKKTQIDIFEKDYLPDIRKLVGQQIKHRVLLKL